MATITAASLSSAHVQAALDLAQAGDTVVLPAGTMAWTAGVARLNVPANVTVQGAGTAATGGGDRTILTDNIASGQRMLQIDVPATGTFRLTGITFQSGTGAIKDNGTVSIGGQVTGVTGVRIDHCHFIASSGSNYKIVQIGCFGLMDHCILDLTGTNAIFFYNGRMGAGEQQGNLEWTLPTAFGSADYFYIEDCIINGIMPSGAYSTRIYDMFTASRAVARFNTVSQSCIGETHATGHAPDDRGGRSQEAYGNLVTSSLALDPNFVALDIENGTTLAWGNSWDQCYKSIFVFKTTRYAGQSGGGPYDQLATPAGWGYAGTAFNGTGSNWDGGTFNATDTVKGYPCLDMPGRGPGDLLVGVFPTKTNQTSGTIKWPNQALEPVYLWNNVGGVVPGWSGVVYNDFSNGRVVANRDYYPSASGVQVSPTSPFNGTVGVGWGTLANRPTTCTAGVAYFAIDQGNWNKSATNPHGVQQSGASGVLYKATATNTWTLYYTPYTYPHPLQGASGGGGGGGGGGGTPANPPGSATYYSGKATESFFNTYYSGTEEFI